jgi:hypothetical protein
VTGSGTPLDPCLAPTDHAGWLKRLQEQFPGVGFVHASVVGRTLQWSAPTPQELERVLRRTEIPTLPAFLPEREVRGL